MDVRGSLALANALADQRIPFALHIYPDAPLGVALANEFTKYDNEKWGNKSISQWEKCGLMDGRNIGITRKEWIL